MVFLEFMTFLSNFISSHFDINRILVQGFTNISASQPLMLRLRTFDLYGNKFDFPTEAARSELRVIVTLVPNDETLSQLSFNVVNGNGLTYRGAKLTNLFFPCHE